MEGKSCCVTCSPTIATQSLVSLWSIQVFPNVGHASSNKTHRHICRVKQDSSSEKRARVDLLFRDLHPCWWFCSRLISVTPKSAIFSSYWRLLIVHVHGYDRSLATPRTILRSPLVNPQVFSLIPSFSEILRGGVWSGGDTNSLGCLGVELIC